MRRVYHRYEKWEEFHSGMWRITTGEERFYYRESAARFMHSTAEFEAAMNFAVTHWPVSSEHWLTCSSVNHWAWIGRAACCVTAGSPEDVTREVWHTLSTQKQDEANAAADRALTNWKEEYAEAQAG